MDYKGPERRDLPETLAVQAAEITKSEIVSTLLETVGGILAVLNENRQVVALNRTFLDFLGISDSGTVLGLRPGEVAGCKFASESPGGCGCAVACSNCGAAIAILTATDLSETSEKYCAIESVFDGKTTDFFFRIRCVPTNVNGNKYVLLFMQDCTWQQKLLNLERVFFHDINGLIGGILGTSSLLAMVSNEEIRELATTIEDLSKRLAGEVAIQRNISKSGASGLNPVFCRISSQWVGTEITNIFVNHSVSKDKKFIMDIPDFNFTTEPAFLIRVLTNMLMNAFEACVPGGKVNLTGTLSGETVQFTVSNPAFMPSNVAARIFQRNFSTKAEMGRGLGTWSMKFFGEEILGGQVGFTTSPLKGTSFYIKLPQRN